MIVKVKHGRTVTVNNAVYRITGTCLDNYDKSSNKVSLSLSLQSYTGDDPDLMPPSLHIQFDEWITGIDEKDLKGLITLLTRG